MPRAKQRTPELRDRVLDVAVETLAAEGVAGFTTRRVAEQAQTSTLRAATAFDVLTQADSVLESFEWPRGARG